MAIFQIFTKHQSRQFKIPYRFYDPAKEEQMERESRIKRKLSIADDKDETTDYKSNISGAFRSRLSPRIQKQQDKSNSTVKILLFAFIMVLAILIYFKLK
ncbi:MAG: hypothetical protein NTY07_11180 [Bacteroidia bacterium]|nr:hypothetical protein [Bacteroidia bacterium]